MIKMRKDIKVRDILEVIDGVLVQGNMDEVCGEFAYDTRSMKNGDVYIGLKADTIDGSQFWEEALKKDSKVVIINDIELDKKSLEKWSDRTVIIVKNSLEALQKIAAYKRILYGNDLKVVAITGSVGKTSTKDMVANVIAQKYKTLKTMGNYNNHIGLPLTLLHLTDQEVAVVEMGMNHLGEIDLLTNIAKPDLAIITNIGTSHIGNLGSRENILKAKLEILNGMKNKEIIVNQDNDLLGKWHKDNDKNTELKIHSFGIESKCDVWATDIKLNENGSKFICHLVNNEKEEEFLVNVPVGGIHFVYNALCATLVGKILNIDNEKIKNGIESFSLTKKRMEIQNFENNITVINDAYNASFESIKASLTTLDGYKNRRKIAVLGDVFELGDFAEEMHKKIGDAFIDSSANILVCCGDNAKFIAQEAESKNKNNEKVVNYLKDKESVLKYLTENVVSGDVIIFKASNGMKFFELCNQFEEKIKKL